MTPWVRRPWCSLSTKVIGASLRAVQVLVFPVGLAFNQLSLVCHTCSFHLCLFLLLSAHFWTDDQSRKSKAGCRVSYMQVLLIAYATLVHAGSRIWPFGLVATILCEVLKVISQCNVCVSVSWCHGDTGFEVFINLSFARSSWDLHRPLRQSKQSRGTSPDKRERPGTDPEDGHCHGLVQLRVRGARVQVRRGRCVHAGCGGN